MEVGRDNRHKLAGIDTWRELVSIAREELF
jgi:hypothetical protein